MDFQRDESRMSREISELLALYDKRLSVARRENELLRAKQIKFGTEAEALFRAVVGPMFERLETQIKNAGHQVWIRQSFPAVAGGAIAEAWDPPSYLIFGLPEWPRVMSRMTSQSRALASGPT